MNAAGTSCSYTLIFERGKIPCQISLSSSGLVNGLCLGAMVLFNDSRITLRNAFTTLGKGISVCVTRNGISVFQMDDNTPLAVGSACKLYILKALQEKITRGKARWRDAVLLKEEWIPVGGGILEQWPVGAPVTLQTLASLMISLSDNTATAQLLFILGRQTVETAAPRRVRPFLSTLELIKLKWTAGGEKGRAGPRRRLPSK